MQSSFVEPCMHNDEQAMQNRVHLLKSALCDGYQAGSEGLGLNTQTADHIANLHLLKLIAPFALLVHITSDLPDRPA